MAAASMMGTVRLYIEVQDHIPESHRPPITHPVIDCHPSEAAELKKRLQRRGYKILAVPL
jgi:hypothetical protein